MKQYNKQMQTFINLQVCFFYVEAGNQMIISWFLTGKGAKPNARPKNLKPKFAFALKDKAQ